MDRQLTIWLQEHGSSFHWPLRFVSDLGPSPLLSLGLVVLYWCWDYRVMSRVWMIYLVSSWLTVCLKLVLQYPRPYWIFPEVRGLSHASGFGMPSGHSLVTTAVWGEFFRLRKISYVRAACVAVILGVGVSRIYLGVHSLAQVVAGIVCALGLLGIYPLLERRLSSRFQAFTIGKQLTVIFLGSLAAASAALAARAFAMNFDLPDEWTDRALEKRPRDGPLNPFDLRLSIISAGTVLGFLGGYRLLVHWNRDQRARDWNSRLKRTLLGSLIMGPIVFGERYGMTAETLAGWPMTARLALHYTFGVTAGSLVSLGLPMLFHRLRW